MNWTRGRFSLRTLLFVVTAICVVLGVLVMRANQQRAIYMSLMIDGVYVLFDGEAEDRYAHYPQSHFDLLRARRLTIPFHMHQTLSEVSIDTDHFEHAQDKKYSLSEVLRRVQCIRRLDSLYLTGGYYGDEAVREIAKCREIRSLSISGAQLSDSAVSCLGTLNGLESLDIRGSTNVSSKAFEHTGQHFRSLRFLDVRNSKFSKEEILIIRLKLPKCVVIGAEE